MGIRCVPAPDARGPALFHAAAGVVGELAVDSWSHTNPESEHFGCRSHSHICSSISHRSSATAPSCIHWMQRDCTPEQIVCAVVSLWDTPTQTFELTRFASLLSFPLMGLAKPVKESYGSVSNFVSAHSDIFSRCALRFSVSVCQRSTIVATSAALRLWQPGIRWCRSPGGRPVRILTPPPSPSRPPKFSNSSLSNLRFEETSGTKEFLRAHGME